MSYSVIWFDAIIKLKQTDLDIMVVIGVIATNA